MKVKAWILSLSLCLAAVTTADAQGPGGRGRGGFGGGMFGGGGPSIIGLAGNEAVQKDIGLGSDSIEKLNALSEDMRSAQRETMRSIGGGDPREMTEEEREQFRQKMTDANKALTDKYLPKLKEILNADQFTRLQQIHWQSMGSMAYSDPEIVKTLNISKDQQDKMAALTKEYATKFRDVFRDGFDREKFQELNKERDGKMTEILTKEQLAQFATLKGKDFDTEQLRGGRGPRGGPGGGGGGGGKGKRPQQKPE